MELLFNFADAKVVASVAAVISGLVKSGDVIGLVGELGSGKTFFVRSFIRCFLPNEVVDSPTFQLMRPYYANSFCIWHMDLYRVKSVNEVLMLGICELIEDNITLIEWPLIVRDIVEISFLVEFLYIDEERRSLRLKILKSCDISMFDGLDFEVVE